MVYMPHWPKVLGKRPIDLDLVRIQALLAQLGNPDQHMPPVVHVAGTNGKGSTIAFLKYIFKAAGYRTHSYTSPHLIEFNERIELNGKPITDDELYKLCEECRFASDELGIHPTFFEGNTAVAFLAFSRHEADICLIETGLGGRLDATNVFPTPACTIITPISMDHMEYLGESIEKIAFEKAGILKPGVPCIMSQQHEAAADIIRERAAELDVPLFEYGKHWMITTAADGMRYVESGFELLLPSLSLVGVHQYLNAGAAVAASRRLVDYTISESHQLAGLQTAEWPGRLQRLYTGSLFSLLPDDWEIWIDGGHNPGGGAAIANWIESDSSKPTYLVTGLTKGKDGTGFLQPMLGLVEGVCGVPVKSEPSAQTAKEVAQYAEEVGIEASAKNSLGDAIKHIAKQGNQPSRILICGSLFLVGDVYKENGTIE